MAELDDSALARLETLQAHYREHARAMDNQIVGWALAANGAAMLLCFNALLDHKFCDIDTVVSYVRVFFTGVVLVISTK